MRSRGKILDATLDLVTDAGFDQITIAAVAERAGVSRQTVYSIFGSREDLVAQAVSQVALAALDDIKTQASKTENVTDFVVEVIVAGRSFARSSPVLVAMLRGGDGNPLFDPGVVGRAKIISEQFLSPIHDQLARPDDVAEIMVHLALSLILFDDPERRDDDLRDFLRRWLGPALQHTQR
ncbi:TetR/AcrR family transcriptional regulator [Gordonia sp. ABSL1-1]|uniref:TetR/AcrR family transcriptional regulator n=1 Tax=Gordonia sp. ABSL1-1 TaxID=3053923 RepID=UPI0025724224|nr:TetR/AcrR family transcriptional regulator [Gordonia sp. ABSL1-1]MDL9935324.1 TetR/AcrR family transcriptional regulator [Gordonia sp. ABSL1-1]